MATRKLEEPQSKAREFKPLPQTAAAQPAVLPLAVAVAIKALHEGRASEHQQRLAFQWIVFEAGSKSQFPYHSNDRDTTFALGRVFVADQILGAVRVDIATLKGG
jgi:hypothetical protein